MSGLACDSTTIDGKIAFNISKGLNQIGTVIFDIKEDNLDNLSIKSEVNGSGESILTIEINSPVRGVSRAIIHEKDGVVKLSKESKNTLLLLSR